MNIGKGVINTFVQRPFTSDVWNQLKEWKIAKSTKRGFRGGRTRSIFTIRTRITSSRIDSTSTRSVNELNLTSVPVSNNITTTKKGYPLTRLAHWNAGSMKKKTTSITDCIIDHKIDLLAITESWLKGDDRDSCPLADLSTTLPHFRMHHLPRKHRKGGGIFLLSHRGLDVKENHLMEFKSFEYMDFNVSETKSPPLRLVAIYRPPPSKENKLTVTGFFRDFSTLLEVISIDPARLVLVGDFNFHLDVDGDHYANAMKDMLDSAGLQQHVTGATHRRGHTLDLLISRKFDNLVSDVEVVTGMPSDHHVVKCLVDIARPKPVKQVVNYRDLKKINLDLFKHDIETSMLSINPADDLSQSVKQYEHVLRDLLDRHAPLKSKSITLRPHAPWYTVELRVAKQTKRRLERKWKKSQLEVDRQIYAHQCKTYTRMLEQAKCDHYRSEISECNDRQLFRVVDKMSRPAAAAAPTLPSYDDAKSLANRFADFFRTKVKKLRDDLDKSSCPEISVDIRDTCDGEFGAFSEVSEDTVRKIIIESPAKSCPLDPIPSSLLKNCLDVILPCITRVVNMSLTTGIMPSDLKVARVVPLLKKPGIDPEDLKNYRPISNLKFLLKTIERVVLLQLNAYLQENGLFAPMQSAYRRHHSTETALLRVQNDLLRAVDRHDEAVLILLDFSAAFDTIDHDILLHRLCQRYGITQTALKWFSTYLRGRTQCIDVGGVLSDEHLLEEGVPQGSVLGPVIFTMYTAPLGDIIASHGLNYMIYADDTQLYMILDRSKRSDDLSRLEKCVTDVKTWAVTNKLMLNDSKTEVVHMSSRFVETPPLPPLTIGDSIIDASESARNLGVIFDCRLDMKQHLKSVTSSASFAIYKIGQIRKYLDPTTTERLVHAFVSSRLDCCNSLLFGLPNCEIAKLQRIQNSAARLVSRSKYRDHITPVLEELHWLPIEYRIEYKILLLTYKALCGLAPTYIKDLVCLYRPSRSLRSSSKNLLRPPSKGNTMYYSDRAFCSAAPSLWNNLPDHVRLASSVNQFKSSLKTHLFKKAYNFGTS